MRKLFDQQQDCLEDNKSGSKACLNCRNLTRIVESVTPYSRSCLTYYSELFGKNIFFPLESNHLFIIDNEIDAFALIHQNITPDNHFTDR
jgi:hypothetical protein